jgi:ribosomal protein L37E
MSHRWWGSDEKPGVIGHIHSEPDKKYTHNCPKCGEKTYRWDNGKYKCTSCGHSGDSAR